MTNERTGAVIDRFTSSDGVKIAYRAGGAGDVVIVCHGGPSTTYEYLVDDLAAVSRRFALVFHDYRGSGISDPAPPQTYSFERLADDVDELRQQLGVERVSVLAHSMGGFVALQYAIRHPQRCRSLALISCSPAGTMQRTALPTLRALGPTRIARLVARATWYVGAWSWRRESAARTASRYSMMHIMQEGNPAFRDAVAAREILAQNDNATTLERAAFQTDLCDRLPSIECPVLVIHGSKDAPFVAGGELLERGVRNVRRVELLGVGHHPVVEENARTSRELMEFLGMSAEAARS